jgi:hypothetical protein
MGDQEKPSPAHTKSPNLWEEHNFIPSLWYRGPGLCLYCGRQEILYTGAALEPYNERCIECWEEYNSRKKAEWQDE